METCSRIASRDPKVRRARRVIARASHLALMPAAVSVAAALAGPISSAVAASAPPPPAGWESGWQLPHSAFVGRYRLRSSKPVNPGRQRVATKGQLTLFMQTTYAGEPPVPSGIISLHTAKSSVVLYLTDLDHHGTTLESLVHGGAFVAPATGRFTLMSLKRGTIVGTLREKGMATSILKFTRFSRNPQP